MHPLALDPGSTVLLVVDVQEKLCAAMPEGGVPCIERVGVMVEGARILEMPVVVTEQYPRGLGRTVGPVLERLATFAAAPPIFEKVEFAATGNDAVQAHLDGLITRGQVRAAVVVGMEAHVCVYQTVRGLRERGLAVHVALDAVTSRTAANVEIARGLYGACGAVTTSTETVLFDLLGNSGTERFKSISRLIR
jgi:nicotinamidase-related amidase